MTAGTPAPTRTAGPLLPGRAAAAFPGGLERREPGLPGLGKDKEMGMCARACPGAEQQPRDRLSRGWRQRGPGTGGQSPADLLLYRYKICLPELQNLVLTH